MRSSVGLFLVVTVAMFGLGLSLQCYSCPNGSTQKCEVKRECTTDSCLKLKSGGKTYTSCVRYAECDYNHLSNTYYDLSTFKFTCCQTDLCNGPSFFEMFG